MNTHPAVAERGKLTVEEYLAELLALVGPITDTEVVPLAEAAGRTLAAAVQARGDVPAFANSAMDGFAVRLEGLTEGQLLREVGDVPAGSAEDPPLGPGECVRIMTGAPMPSQADTVVQREHATELPDAFGPGLPGVRVDQVPARVGLHVRHAGEDFTAGAELLFPGTVLGPHALALAAGCGVGEVRVVRRPVVAVVATGDELVAPGGELRRGQIHESNLTQLAAAIAQAGALVENAVVLPDDPKAFADGLDRVSAGADLVVMSGGVSAGDHDVVRITLSERAGGTFRHIQMQPGRPQGWARWNGVPVIGLPGNPLSTAVSHELFVRPLLEKLLGQPERRWSTAVAAEAWNSPEGRRQFIPVVVEHDDQARQTVRPAHARGSASHMVSALSRADALAEVPAETSRVEPGTLLRIRSL